MDGQKGPLPPPGDSVVPQVRAWEQGGGVRDECISLFRLGVYDDGWTVCDVLPCAE